MSQSRVRTRIAMVGAMSLLAAPVLAQAPGASSTAYWVSFPSGSTVLHQADQETIRGVASMMKRDTALHASIVGKADKVGTKEFNEELSKKRTDAVYEALVRGNQIAADRVDVHWSGERLPNVPTQDEQAELQNRVVEVMLH